LDTRALAGGEVGGTSKQVESFCKVYMCEHPRTRRYNPANHTDDTPDVEEEYDDHIDMMNDIPEDLAKYNQHGAE
jgi:hypothetical protein